MGAHVRELTASHHGSQATTFHELPRMEDVQGRDHDHAGLITGDWLAEHTPLEGAQYFLCGPRPFLRNFVSTPYRQGVPGTRSQYEFFGPADELLAA
jgi:nitric oxide dioxygenase